MKNIIIITCLCWSLFGFAKEQVTTVAYHNVCNPWKWKIANNAFKKAIKSPINWVKLDTGDAVVKAVKNGDVQLALMGSSTFAAGVANGLNAQLIWIMEDIRQAEALVVRADGFIEKPQDLIGKTIAVPFYTTTHYHLLFALEQFGIAITQVNIVNLQTEAIANAFIKQEIDAGFVWDPALGQMLQNNGRVLITSGQLADWGRLTFDGLVVDSRWGEQNKQLVSKFIDVVAAAAEDYRNNPQKWHAKSKRIQAMVKLSNCDAQIAVATLAKYNFPSKKEQATTQWLGGGQSSGASHALYHTALFLKQQKAIASVPKSYASFVSSLYIQ